jgi:hypothetical protein
MERAATTMRRAFGGLHRDALPSTWCAFPPRGTAFLASRVAGSNRLHMLVHPTTRLALDIAPVHAMAQTRPRSSSIALQRSLSASPFASFSIQYCVTATSRDANVSNL